MDKSTRTVNLKSQSKLRQPTTIKRALITQPNHHNSDQNNVQPKSKKIKLGIDGKENAPTHGQTKPRSKISNATSGRQPCSKVISALSTLPKGGRNTNDRSKKIISKPIASKTAKTGAASSKSAPQSKRVITNTKATNKASQSKNSAQSFSIEELDVKLAAMQAEAKKLPKWDIKRKGEIYQEGFHLIPLLRQSYTDQYGDYEEKTKQITTENQKLKDSFAELDKNYKSSTAQVTSLTNHLDRVQRELNLKMEECGRLTQTVEKLNNEIHNHLKTIDERDAEIRENEAIRRKLHNEVQELKGNIRVYCRVRPLLKGEDNQDCDLPITFDSNCDKNIQIHHSNTNDDGCRRTTSEKYDFTFDKVFNPTSAQEDIFLEISQLVQSALDGYNVCIFAYGQTGSGKTYTMEGCVDHNSGSNNARAGMIPRTVNQIFTSASALSSKGWKYDIEASFLEIYNETVRDLLEDNHKKKENIKYEIKLTKSSNGVNHVAVTNAKIVKVESERQVYDLLKVASRHRATAATKCNEYSSRSHSVFRLNLIGSNSLTGQNCEGTLNLVDLAGSERINVSGATGDRLNEAKNINKSLSTLSKVILSLANKDSHIPYRNSKLTYLLQNSLGGNSKTLMFVNISPSIHCFHESLSSLRFATKVNNCHIGTATKKVK